MENEESLEPEWDLFARLEKTEEAYKQLQKKTNKLRKEVKEDVKPTLMNLYRHLDRIVDLSNEMVTQIQDTNLLAMEGCFLGFLALSRWNPDYVRRLKDIVVGVMRESGLEADTLNELESNLLRICDATEKRRR